MILKIGVQFPWWWKLYLGAVTAAHNIGAIEADAETAAAFVMKHAIFYAEDSVGRRTILDKSSKVDRRTRRYFERAPIGHHVHPNDLDLDHD